MTISAKRLYFLRHGLADPDQYTGPDDLRPLTVEGRRNLHETARFLAARQLPCDRIVSSPLVRAVETAEIIAAGLGLSDRLVVADRVRCGFRAADLGPVLAEAASNCRHVMLVGHEPDFSQVIGALTGGLVVMKKGALARVDLLDGRRGQLVWLLQPKVLLATDA